MANRRILKVLPLFVVATISLSSGALAHAQAADFVQVDARHGEAEAGDDRGVDARRGEAEAADDRGVDARRGEAEAADDRGADD